jgi:hypothetical protein
MKSKEQLLLEIKGVLAYQTGDKVRVKGNIYTTPFDEELVYLNEEREATIFDLIVPGYCPYEITFPEINEEGEEIEAHYFCHEDAIIKEEE